MASSEPTLVREHDTLVCGARQSHWKANITALTPEDFEAVQDVLLDTRYDLSPVATLTRFEGRPALKLNSWVGVIRTPSGTIIEILPKTHERPGGRTQPDSLLRSRKLLLRMLELTDEAFRTAPPAELQTLEMPLYEVVIRYALEGIQAAVRRGIPHAYVPIQEERSGLRGHIDLPRQIRQPPHRAHLLHVQYDEFLPDRPETRLTRLTVERLATLTTVISSRRLARELLYQLDEVPPSRNLKSDFAAWRLGRSYVHFTPLESICKMVLYELNPVVAGSETHAHALLFDMNKVYEAYVAEMLRRLHPDWIIESQRTDKSLGLVNEQGVFGLRPDLVLHTPDGQVVIADTKWKRLKADQGPTYDVASADAYQMLAYSEIFQSKQPKKALWLLYPRLPGLPPVSQAIQLGSPQWPHERHLSIVTIDLESTELVEQWPERELHLGR